jgi:hypothetical protein
MPDSVALGMGAQLMCAHPGIMNTHPWTDWRPDEGFEASDDLPDKSA